MGKEINLSHVTDSAGLPFLSRSIDWIQQNIKESDIALQQSINQTTNGNEVWQLYFKEIKNTTGNSNLPATVSSTWTWDLGYVVYNYQIYTSPAGTATLGIGEFLVWYFITTAQAGEPTTYTDGTSFQTNENVTIGIRKNTEGAYIQAVDLLRYINLEKSVTSASDLYWKLIKRGNVWTFTYKSTLNSNEGRHSVEIMKNFNGTIFDNQIDFVGSLGNFVGNTPSDLYGARLLLTGTTLSANVQAGSIGSISFVA